MYMHCDFKCYTLHFNFVILQIDSGGERVQILNLDTVQVISQLLRVDQDILIEALVTRKAKAGGIDSFVTHYKLDEVGLVVCACMLQVLFGVCRQWLLVMLWPRHCMEHCLTG